MVPELKVQSITAEEISKQHYDVFFATVGFEKRARYFAKTLQPEADLRVACGFAARKVLQYTANWRWFESAGFEPEIVDELTFPIWCKKQMSFIRRRSKKTRRCCVDISSMSRFRIATMVESFSDAAHHHPLTVDFVYCPSKYSSPPKEGPIVVSRAVTARFVGWSDEPDKPLLAILGLGYEPDRAVGTLEYLEPALIWVFRPNNKNQRYEKAIEIANKGVYDNLPADRSFRYHIEKPLDCLVKLESLVNGSLRLGRPVLIPFGPKVFALNCLLVATMHYPNIVVWRVSSEQYDTPNDRVASGEIIGLSVCFMPRSKRQLE